MFKFRKTRWSDAKKIVELCNMCMYENFTCVIVLDALYKCDFRYNYVCIVDQKLVGYLLCSMIGNTITIVSMCIHPAYRNKKIASVLLNISIYEAIQTKEKFEINLHVRSDNKEAINLYRKTGFETCLENIPYYENGKYANYMIFSHKNQST